MKIYIAYKYRRVSDKKGLIGELENLSNYFSTLGHNAFILGRDVQNWDSHENSQIRTIFDIFKNIQKKDLLFIYINSPVRSNGLPVEVLLAKLFGLKIILSYKNGIKPPWICKLADHCFEFPDIETAKEYALEILHKLAK